MADFRPHGGEPRTQNVLSRAVFLGLGAVPVGAFYDEDVQQVLALSDDQPPLYLIPVGALQS
ncbi:MAG: nitroreductase family protein [Caldilineales bacterium]